MASTGLRISGLAVLCLMVSGLVVLDLAALPAGAHAGTSLETEVKTAYISKFAPFVTWPASPDHGAAFTVCVVGHDPFGPGLDAAISGLTYDDRPYSVVRVATIGPGSTCDIAYIGGASQEVAAALQAVRGTPTLTITDDGAPAGIIAFKMQAGKVRFRIDQTAAEANHLTISSKLLSLAISVRTDQGVIEP